jgi:CPA1 family monovalent cation:H+ antiporter
LSLPPLIRLLHLEADDGLEDEVKLAREHAATAALTRLDQLTGEDWAVAEHAERLRHQYGRRLERLSRSGAAEVVSSADAAESFRRLQHEAMVAERTALIGLRNAGTISDEVLHHLEQELDVASLHLGVGDRRQGDSGGGRTHARLG